MYSPVVGKSDTPIGRDPAWVNFENEDFTWNDLAHYLANRFSRSDIEELARLLLEHLRELYYPRKRKRSK